MACLYTFYYHLHIIFVCTYVVTTINFDKSVYSIDEVDGAIHPVLILSNPLLKTVTVKVLSTDGSAIGKKLQITIYVTGNYLNRKH